MIKTYSFTEDEIKQILEQHVRQLSGGAPVEARARLCVEKDDRSSADIFSAYVRTVERGERLSQAEQSRRYANLYVDFSNLVAELIVAHAALQAAPPVTKELRAAFKQAKHKVLMAYNNVLTQLQTLEQTAR